MLNLSSNEALSYRGGAYALADASSGWPCLRELKLHDCELEDRGVEALMAGSWARLEVLDLAINGLTAKAIHALAKAHWPCLRELDLSGEFEEDIDSYATHKLGPTDAAALVAAELPCLEKLRLNAAHLGPEGAAVLAAVLAGLA